MQDRKKRHFPTNDCGAPFSLRVNPELFVEISNSKQKIQLLWPWMEAGNSDPQGCADLPERGQLRTVLGSSVVIVLLP